MTKEELIRAVSKDTDLKQVGIKLVLESVIRTMTETLKNGESIVIRNFGTFKVVHLNARSVVNSFSNSKGLIHIPERKKVSFEPSKNLLQEQTWKESVLKNYQ